MSYDANCLNQYTQVTRESEPFAPCFDADGNQTRIKTSTGIWEVTYDANDRPVVFTSRDGRTTITCSYDFRGRRFEKKVTVHGAVSNHSWFLYRDYLQAAQLDLMQPEPVIVKSYLWDPTEPTATRLLMMTCWQENERKVKEHLYFMHDALKNVTSIFDGEQTRRAHYEYAPFGALLTAEGDRAQENKFRFSCEFSDDELGLVYYNYRHLNPADGRWINRDPIQEQGGWNLFTFIKNQPNHYIDKIGLNEVIISGGCNTNMGGMDFSSIYFDRFLTYLTLNAVKKLGFPTFHDRNWSNFITAAEEQIKKRKKVLGPEEKIEWLVEYETYRIRGINDKNGSQYYLNQIRKKAKELDVELRFYKSKKDLALLVNSVQVIQLDGVTETLTTVFMERIGKDRISRFVYYGHGVPGSLTPRYPFPTHGLPITEISITSEDINQGIFQQGSFIQGAVVISCGCNTATSPGNDKPSFSKVWEGFFGSAMYGVKGKTDYTDPRNPHPSTVPTNDPPRWIPKEPPL